MLCSQELDTFKTLDVVEEQGVSRYYIKNSILTYIQRQARRHCKPCHELDNHEKWTSMDSNKQCWILSSMEYWLQCILDEIPPLFMFEYVSMPFIVTCYQWLILLDFWIFMVLWNWCNLHFPSPLSTSCKGRSSVTSNAIVVRHGLGCSTNIHFIHSGPLRRPEFFFFFPSTLVCFMGSKDKETCCLSPRLGMT